MELVATLAGGFAHVFDARIFAAMLLGIAVGFVVGVVPGIGGPATLALLIPFTFSMDSFGAMALLLGMISATGSGGDMTSVLFGIPGETSSAATLVDGYPMTKNGEAGRALGAVLSAAMVGGIFGAVCLAIGIIIVRPLVLSVGYAEFFMLALAGITFMASLADRAVIKGLCAGGLGLMLSMVGLDPVVGTQRFTFDQVFLWDGIGVLPMMLGLYAVPELIDMARDGRSYLDKKHHKLSGVRDGVLDTIRHFWLVIRCSALGTYIGLIPGIGATVGSWVAYGHAAQSAKERSKIGHGAVEGVLGPGAANNATMSGALIPTIGFGVPGSPQMAILLGAFIIHDLVPGPKMLMPESQGGHLTLTFTMVAVIIVSNLIVTSFSFLFLKQLVRIASVRHTLLLSFILLLICIGSFAEKNALPDMLLTLAFGVLGWLMLQANWPRPPLILGFVLGPLIENNLFQTIAADGTAWLTRPSVLLIFALIALSLAYAPIKRFRGKRESATAPGDRGETTPAASLLSFFFAASIACLLAAALWASRDWVWESRMIPWAFGFLSLALAVTQVALEGRQVTRSRGGRARVGRHAVIGPEVVTTWLTIIGGFAVVWTLGFPLAVLLVPFVYMRFVGKEAVRLAVALSAAGFVLFQMVFHCMLHVPFPEGWLIGFIDGRLGMDISGDLRSVLDALCISWP